MIRTYTLDCHAANPQMPLEPVCPYTGSAATFILINLPRPHGKQRIDAVTLSITNADAAVSAHPATREGSSWIVTVPAAAIGPAGNVREAIIISASGVDEQNRPVPSWIVAVADLRVKNQDGTAVPGEPRVLISWFDFRPANPRGVFICPCPDGQAALDLYDGHNYRPLVGGGTDVLGKLPLRALPKYLHYLAFDDTYPADAAWLYAQLGPSEMGRCSAVRRGGKLWRKYDWTFDDSAEFVAKVYSSSSRFGSVGVASVGSRLTENDVMSAVNSRYYKCLPGMTLDGINEKGVVCEINVDGGPKDGWHGDADEGGIHILAAVRWVLDHGETAAQAAEWIADHIIQPQGEMNFHFMVADATSTYIVENGVAHLVPSSLLEGAVLTNYALYDSAHAGGGKERYQLLAGGADISAVNFTNAYQSGNNWDSDFESAAQHLAAIEQWAAQGTDKEAHRGKTTSSGKAWWQSVHTTEYDFAAKTMKVAVQETDDWYTFQVPESSLSGAVDDTVTRTSENPVKSSGIWSAVWGTLAALPTGFSSLYDWCASQLAELRDGKRDKTDLSVYAWTGDSIPADADGQPYWSESEGFWIWNRVGTMLVYITRDDPGNLPTNTSRTFSDPDGVIAPFAAHIGEVSKLAHTSATSGIAKFGENGELTQAEKSSTSDDPANADYRDPQDNTCHKTEFTEWETTDSRYGVRLAKTVQDLKYWEPYRISDGGRCGENKGSKDAVLVSWNIGDYEGDQPLTATRAAVCTINKPFTTFDIVSALVNGVKTLLGSVASGYSTFADWIASKFDTAKAVPAFAETSTYEVGEIVLHEGSAYKCTTAVTTAGAWTGSANWTAASDADLAARLKNIKSDGTATDTFATDILGKQVANAKVRYALATTASATMDDRTVNIYTISSGTVPLVFPTVTTHDGVTYARDFLLKLTYGGGALQMPQGVTKVGDELSFEAGKTYLIAFTEIAADKFYVRSIDITEAQA